MICAMKILEVTVTDSIWRSIVRHAQNTGASAEDAASDLICEALTTRDQRRKGGLIANRGTTEAQRSAAAKRAALVRWAKPGSDGR